METSKKTSLNNKEQYPDYFIVDHKFGTVGAVALDKTEILLRELLQGYDQQKYGRIGDSPIIGAGTYANEQVGISGTGWGEFLSAQWLLKQQQTA